MKGSWNFEAALNRGLVIGTPIYAGYEPHHQRHPGGAWTYENMYDPYEEVAFTWFARGETIAIRGVWVVTSGDGTYDEAPANVRVVRGGGCDDVIETTIAHVVDVDEFDIIGDENEWLDATLTSNQNLYYAGDFKHSVNDRYLFVSEEDREAFLKEVKKYYSHETCWV